MNDDIKGSWCVCFLVIWFFCKRLGNCGHWMLIRFQLEHTPWVLTFSSHRRARELNPLVVMLWSRGPQIGTDEVWRETFQCLCESVSHTYLLFSLLQSLISHSDSQQTRFTFHLSALLLYEKTIQAELQKLGHHFLSCSCYILHTDGTSLTVLIYCGVFRLAESGAECSDWPRAVSCAPIGRERRAVFRLDESGAPCSDWPRAVQYIVSILSAMPTWLIWTELCIKRKKL